MRQTVENRRRAKRCQPLGELVDAMPFKRWERQTKRRGALVELLEVQLGSAVFKQVTIGPIRRGVLTLEMPDAACAYTCQYQYSMSLREALRKQLPAAGIVDVRFRAHRGDADGRMGNG
ncbi:MAG TPA: DciA family protein [Mycobacterium sp.]